MAEIGQHFTAHYGQYLASLEGPNRILYQNIKETMDPYIEGDVLDLGNGGIFTYDPQRARDILAVDICFTEDTALFKKIPNVTYQYGNAMSLEEVTHKSFDVMIIQFLFHHTAEEGFKKVLGNGKKVISNALKVLRPGGKLIIVEQGIPRIMEFCERAFYGLACFVLKLLNLPPVYIYSKKTLLKLLKEGGFENMRYKIISCGKKLDLLATLKPNKFVVPRWPFFYFKVYFILAEKRG